MSGEVSTVQVFIQALIYCCSILLGIIITIPVAITKSKFDCPLYGKKKEGMDYYTTGSSSCDFVVNLHAVLTAYAVIHAAVHVFLLLHRLAKREELQLLTLYLWNPMSVVLHAITTFTAFVAACMISVGLSTWCQTLRKHHRYLKSCSQAQELRWKESTSGRNDGSSFYDCLTVALVGCWLAVLAWLVQTGLRVLNLFRHYKGN